MSKLEGQSIGRYHIIEPLGEGGMAVVYKAFDTHLECEVAVKVIRVDNLPRNAEERALKRFEREAKVVARLNHPNIVKVTDYGEEDGKPYLVMPYLPGGTLKQLIKERGQIPWQEAARILIPIAEALAYAHEEKVIHRDIKPSNILLTRSGQPMLTDFGVAKIIEDEATQDLTGTSATVGTPEYMAPEQITSKTVDARADLYSLGVVFYEMVTGRKPFEADTPLAVLVKHAHDPLVKPSQYINNLPKEIEYILLKTLSKNPEDRYQNAGEFSQKLKEALSKQNVTKIKTTLNETHDQKHQDFRPAKQTSPGLKILMGCIFFVVLIIGFILIINKTRQKTVYVMVTATISTSDIGTIESETPLPSIEVTDTPAPMPTHATTPTNTSTNTVEPTIEASSTKAPYKSPTPHFVTVDLLNYCVSVQDWYLNGKYITTIGAQDRFDFQILSGYYESKNCDAGTALCRVSEKTWDFTGEVGMMPLYCN